MNAVNEQQKKISDSYYDEYYTDDEIAKLWNRRTED
jgi:hypothetical protein